MSSTAILTAAGVLFGASVASLVQAREDEPWVTGHIESVCESTTIVSQTLTLNEIQILDDIQKRLANIGFYPNELAPARKIVEAFCILA